MIMLVSIRRIPPVLLLVSAAAAAVAGLIAQSPQLNRFVLTEEVQVASPASREQVSSAGRLPPLIQASEYSPGYARRNLVPAMGGSIAAGDFDGDGESDLYVVDPGRGNTLLRNTGKGVFRDITATAKVAGPGTSLSASWSDYDRSGYASLFVAGAEGIRLYHNDGGGTFSDVTRKAGLQTTPDILCTGVVLGDIDGDGFSDLLVTVYTDLNRPPSKPAFTFPSDFSGAASRLYRNRGDGTFVDVTRSAGLGENPGRARKAMFADFNSDYRPDILILRDDKPPVLYLNSGLGQFRDATWDAGDGLTRHAFFDGAAVDLNLDGKLDIVLWSTQSVRALLNRGNAVFEPAQSLSMREPLFGLFGFHGMVADLDEDGFDDVVAVDKNGRMHAFANHAGVFREAPLTIPPGLERASLIPVRPNRSSERHLLGIQSDGRIALLATRSDRSGR